MRPSLLFSISLVIAANFQRVGAVGSYVRGYAGCTSFARKYCTKCGLDAGAVPVH